MAVTQHVTDRFRGATVHSLSYRGTNVVGGASFSVSSESTNAITVSVQLQDETGADIAFAGKVDWYWSSSASGGTLGTAPTGGIAGGTDGLIVETLANQAGYAVSESDGDIDFVLTDTGTPTGYLVLAFGNGKVAISDAVTWA